MDGAVRVGLRRGLVALLVLLVLSAPVAAAGGDGDERREGPGDDDDLSEGAATAALAFLGVTSAYVPFNVAKRRLLVPRLRRNPAALKRLTLWSRNVVLPLHLVTGFLAFAVGAVHGFTAKGSNLLLWSALVLMGLLVVGGALMRWKWAPASVKKGAYLLHAQQVLFWALLALLAAGHFFVED